MSEVTKFTNAIRELFYANIAELRTIDFIRKKGRITYSLMIASVIITWLACIYIHYYTPYLQNILPVNIVAVILLVENIALLYFCRASFYNKYIYFGNLFVDLGLLFITAYTTGGSHSLLIFLPLLYLLAAFFIHGIIQGGSLFTYSLLGYLLPVLFGFFEFEFLLQVALFLIIILPIIFVPIWVMLTLERKEAEKALLKGTERYRELVESLPQPLFEADIAGNITYMNQAGLDFFGLKQEDIDKGMNVFDFIAPEDMGKAQANFTTTFDSVHSNEYIGLKKNGERIPLISFMAPVLQNERPIGLRGILMDLSERKKMEEELWKLNHKNELILNSLGEGVYGVNMNGEATFINPAMLKMLGYSLEELIGKNLHTIIHHSKADGTAYPADECKIYAAYRDGGVTNRVNNEVFWRKDGTSFMVDYISTPIIEDNKIAGAVVVFHDITEQKLYEQQLKEVNTTKDKFFSIITHDLKNPFNALLGSTEALHENIDNFNKEDLRDLSNIIYRSSRNTYALLKNLLEWSKSQTGRLEFKPEELRLGDIAYESIKSTEDQAQVKGVTLSNKTGDTTVFADANLLKTIIRNLISNAIKYTNKGGRITISSKQNNNMVEVSVSDTGVGMPPDAMENIFRIDTKYSTPGTAKETGTGLGLILCKEFVEKHGGNIWVESKVGEGTTFTFTLPVITKVIG